MGVSVDPASSQAYTRIPHVLKMFVAECDFKRARPPCNNLPCIHDKVDGEDDFEEQDACQHADAQVVNRCLLETLANVGETWGDLRYCIKALIF